jgi:hypothetical protein
MTGLRRQLVAFGVALVLLPVAVHARNRDRGCGNPQSPPGDLSLHLSLKNDQTVFRQGEIIALKAEYRASLRKKYSLNNASYDRSGRLDRMETFCIEPESGVDPLSDYFTGMTPFGILGGGLFSDQDPGSQPYIAELELNEWRSLPPGSYLFRIAGYRVFAQKAGGLADLNGKVIPLRSNIVAFQVVKAEPEWQAAQLVTAERMLDSPGSTKEERRHAARVLRFLGSEAATQELARRFSRTDAALDWDFKFGLWGSPFRASAIRGLKAALKDPQHPVTIDLVDTLVAMELQADPACRPTGHEKNIKEVKEAWSKASAEYNRRVTKYMSEAASTTDTKGAAARP